MYEDIKEAQQKIDKQLEELKIREAEVAKKEQLILAAEDYIKAQDSIIEAQVELNNKKREFEKECNHRLTLIEQQEADIKSRLADLERREKEEG